jgi:hypothetical protein
VKRILSVVALAALPFFGGPAYSRSASSTVMISARVDAFAEWADAAPVIFETEWSGPIDKVHQNRTVSKTVVLYSNTDAIISVQPGPNGGVLSDGNETLKTAYQLTGPVTTPDAGFKEAGSGPGQFFNSQNRYHLAYERGTGAYPITLTVQMSSPDTAAPEVGVYTCGVILTAEW